MITTLIVGYIVRNRVVCVCCAGNHAKTATPITIAADAVESTDPGLCQKCNESLLD